MSKLSCWHNFPKSSRTLYVNQQIQPTHAHPTILLLILLLLLFIIIIIISLGQVS